MVDTAAAHPRHRLSAWCAIEDFLGGGKQVVPKIFLDKIRPGDRRPIVDDLSLQRTIQELGGKDKFGADGELEDIDMSVRFDPMSMQFATSDAEKAKVVTAIIDHCHQVLGIQCLIGFTHGNAKDATISRWLNLPVVEQTPLGNSPRHDAFCDKILAFCEANFPGYDGVSFDLEGVPVFRRGKPDKQPDFKLWQQSLASGEEHERMTQLGHQENDFFVWRVTTNLTHLYRTLALKTTSPPLRPPSKAKDRGWDRVVAFAAAGLIGKVPDAQKEKERAAQRAKDQAAGKTPDPVNDLFKTRLLQHDGADIKRGPGANDFVTKDGTRQPAEASFRMHDYFGVRGVRNAIIRPMAYDAFKRDDPRQVLDDWHADIVRYVKRVMNLHPGNFQLGIKTLDGDGQTKNGMDGVMKDPLWVKQRCRDLLAPEDLGVSLFAASVSFWKDANDGLNATNPRAGLRDGPIQVPLNAKAEAFYTPTKPPLKP